MKFLYCQDTHIKGVNPCNRIGDYYQDIMAKIKEIISLSKKLKVDCVIHGGDVFDSAHVSDIMVDEFIDLIEDANLQGNIFPCNHDMIGHNWKLSKGSSLAHIFRRSDLIKELGKLDITNKGNKLTYRIKTIIQGFKYYHNIEQDIKDKGLNCKVSNSKFKIAIIHSMLTLKPFHPQVMHVVAKDIKTDFDVVLCAHYHMGWGIKELKGVKFVNIGGIGRRGIDEVKNVPKVAYIDTETQEIRLMPLKSAKKGEEVFDLTKIEIAKKFEHDIDNFITSLKNTKIQGLNLRGTVEMIAKENNIDKEVKEEVIKRIGEFENE